VPALREGAAVGDPVVVAHPDGEAALAPRCRPLLELPGPVPIARTADRRLLVTTAGQR